MYLIKKGEIIKVGQNWEGGKNRFLRNSLFSRQDKDNKLGEIRKSSESQKFFRIFFVKSAKLGIESCESVSKIAGETAVRGPEQPQSVGKTYAKVTK